MSESNIERTPDGLDQHAPGAKVDAGKILADDILSQFPRALWTVCELGTIGASKYTLGGWQHVEDGERRYANAQMRHKLKEWMGEEIDEETEVLHATADAWNALARLELILRRQEKEKTEKNVKTPKDIATRHIRTHAPESLEAGGIFERAMQAKPDVFDSTQAKHWEGEYAIRNEEIFPPNKSAPRYPDMLLRPGGAPKATVPNSGIPIRHESHMKRRTNIMREHDERFTERFEGIDSNRL